MIGKTVSHYRIIDEIGRGGMGVVYRAEDTKLKRTVALKFLPPEFTRDPAARERFHHEAQAAAALNHTNICTIYEIDEHEEQSFISMEHVDGRSLKDIIESGPMKLGTAVDIAMQIAQGLSHAHENHVVHRDIKPANIMVTEQGFVKIMDFGLAKIHSQTILTKEGTTLGTVAYMSPEQARGEAVDSRTDIWSLGVLLFEMISGRRPFGGEYDQAMIYSVLNEEPEPLSALRTGVPLELERIANKCMEKDPAERYQTARDLIADFRHLKRMIDENRTTSRTITPMAPPSAQPSSIGKRNWIPLAAIVVVIAAIAIFTVSRFIGPSQEQEKLSSNKALQMIVVLPFENLGPPEDGYFANGITDAITARLAGLSGLGVISRQSAMQYKDSGKPIGQIGEELGVDFVLEGTIQRERPSDPNSRVRIIPQLIRCSDDIHMWAETYDEDMTEVFRVQSAIAEHVAKELGVTLLGEERTALAPKMTDNIEAYEYYLLGIEDYDDRVMEESAKEAVRLFKKAVELDPGFAEAWARLSQSYTWLYWRGTDRNALNDARKAVDKALRLDPDLPEGHLALGFLHYYGSRDYDKALEQFHAVERRMPSNAEAIKAIGYIKRRQGHFEEALDYFHRARKIEPRGYMMYFDNFGNTLTSLRRFDEAEKFLDIAISYDSDMPYAYLSKAAIAIARDGDCGRAKELLVEAYKRAHGNEKCLIFLNVVNSIYGRVCYDNNLEIQELFEIGDCSGTDPLQQATFFSWKAEIAFEEGRMKDVAAYADSIRLSIEDGTEKDQDELAMLHSVLGFAYARLGRNEEAISEGERAVSTFPVSFDANDAPVFILILSEIYAITGEYDSAIDQIDLLLSIPSGITLKLIELDPLFAPLREHPRFEELKSKYPS
jgi:serine/threonine protein kinase/tetratricopeptide (TPR) repeat protein